MRFFQRSFSAALLMSHPTSSGSGTTSLAAAASSSSSTGDNDNNGDIDVPQLPSSTGDNDNIPSIKLGETIRFEQWGPIILNTDGSTRRIANWDNLTEQEKEVTWRRIAKRNEERRLALLKQQQEAETAAEQNGDIDL